MNAEKLLYTLTDYLTDPSFISNSISILVVCVGCFILGSLLRLLFGRNCTAVKSVTVVFGILILYLTVFSLQAMQLPIESYLPSLPFAVFGRTDIVMTPIMTLGEHQMWVELLDLILLVVIMGLLDDLLPRGKNILLWLLLRILTVAGAGVSFIFVNRLLNTFLPGVVLNYAPMILLALLGLLLAVTLFKWLIGLILGLSGGPVLGAIYTFFISNIIGKQLTKAALSSGILMLLIQLAEQYDMTVISFQSPVGLFLVPGLVLLLLVWYLINKLF